MFGATAFTGGWGGIRTHETLAGLPVFKTGAFNRSATHPWRENSYSARLINVMVSVCTIIPAESLHHLLDRDKVASILLRSHQTRQLPI
jgi:hypothetical protein